MSLKSYHGCCPWPSYYDITLFFPLSHKLENLLLRLSHSGPQYNFWSTRTKETTNFYYHYGVNKNVQFSLLYYYFTAAISKHFCREGAKYLTKKEKKVRRNYRNWKIFWEGLHSATAAVTWTMGKNLKKVRSQKGQEVHIFCYIPLNISCIIFPFFTCCYLQALEWKTLNKNL